MIRRPPRSTQSRSSAASDVYKRQLLQRAPSNSHEIGTKDPTTGDHGIEVAANQPATTPSSARRRRAPARSAGVAALESHEDLVQLSPWRGGELVRDVPLLERIRCDVVVLDLVRTVLVLDVHS